MTCLCQVFVFQVCFMIVRTSWWNKLGQTLTEVLFQLHSCFLLIFMVTSNLSFVFFCKTLETKSQLAIQQLSIVFFSFNLFSNSFPNLLNSQPLFSTSFFNLFFQPFKKNFHQLLPQIYHNPHNLMKVFTRIEIEKRGWEMNLRTNWKKKRQLTVAGWFPKFCRRKRNSSLK